MPLGHIPVLAIAKIHIKNGKAIVCKSFLEYRPCGKRKAERLKVKAAGKREQRKSLLLLCRAGAGSSARSVFKGERLKVKTESGKGESSG